MRFPPRTAAEIGLILETVPDAELHAHALALARRMAQVPVNQLVMLKLLCNQTVENMGFASSRMLGTLFDGVARHTQEGLDFVARAGERGLPGGRARAGRSLRRLREPAQALTRGCSRARARARGTRASSGRRRAASAGGPPRRRSARAPRARPRSSGPYQRRTVCRELLGRNALLDRRDAIVEPARGIVDHLEDVAGIAQAPQPGLCGLLAGSGAKRLQRRLEVARRLARARAPSPDAGTTRGSAGRRRPLRASVPSCWKSGCCGEPGHQAADALREVEAALGQARRVQVVRLPEDRADARGCSRAPRSSRPRKLTQALRRIAVRR